VTPQTRERAGDDALQIANPDVSLPAAHQLLGTESVDDKMSAAKCALRSNELAKLPILEGEPKKGAGEGRMRRADKGREGSERNLHSSQRHGVGVTLVSFMVWV